MSILLGFDPGGAKNFGWCVAGDSPELPLSIIATGLANDASTAVQAALAAIPTGRVVLAAGIDAPLVWSRSGPRNSDRAVRTALQQAGVKNVSGRVQDVNSLQGACLAQGLLAGIELRERFPSVPLTEAHPKALRLLCPEALAFTHISEHGRDAVLAAFTAWALVHKPHGWSDLFAREVRFYSPLADPLAYFMPLSGEFV